MNRKRRGGGSATKSKVSRERGAGAAESTVIGDGQELPPFPYENLLLSPEHTAVLEAEQVLESGWKGSAANPVVHLDEPIPWGGDAPQLRSWNFNIHSLDMLHHLLLAYSLTGNQRYLEPALRVASSWVDSQRQALPREVSPFAWYDMAVGLRGQRMAYVFDAAIRRGLFKGSERDHMLEALAEHSRFLADDANIAFHSNHGFYQVAGQLSLARRLQPYLPELGKVRQQALERFSQMLELQFSEEGVHREHSPDYHRMVYESLMGVIQAGLVDGEELLGRINQIEDALAWFIYPNGNLVNFGDTDSRSMLRGSTAAKQNWRCNPMRHIASAGAIGTPPKEASRAFPESGYWVMKTHQPDSGRESSGTYLAIAAAFHSRTHKHADDLTFVWYERGEEVVVDSGKYGYLGKTEPSSKAWHEGFWYDNPKRMYVESTRAHNVIEIDGRDYERKDVKPYGSALSRYGVSPNGLYFCEAETRHFRSIRHVRILISMPGEWLIVFDWLHDNLDQPHKFKQWLHLSPAFSVDCGPDGFTAYSPSQPSPLRIISLFPQPKPIDPVIGQELPRMQGFHSPVSGELMPNYAIGYERDGSQSITFATLLCFSNEVAADHAWSRVAASGRNMRLRWAADGVLHELELTRPDGGEIDVSYSRT